MGCYYCIFFQGLSHNPQLKTWYISATLLLCKHIFLRCWRGKLKGCARHGFRENEMKKSLLIAAFIIGAFSVKSQVAISEFTPLQKGFNSAQWFPYVSIMTNDGSSFLLLIRNPDTDDYKKIPSNGKLLVKFANDSIITLHHTDIEQQRDYLVGNYGRKGILYYTYDSYYIDDIDYFLNNEITKVRVELVNYNYFDFEIKKSDQQGLKERLNSAFRECVSKYQEKSNKRDNFNEGF